ncbi:MAG: OmpA family protein [Flavobacteriales bacterium AspAUS03]
MSNQQKGIAIGSGSGAVVGGVIGKVTGNNTALGTILGAVMGGVAGGLISTKMDRKTERIKSEIPTAEVKRVGEGINVTFDEKSGLYFGFAKIDINKNSGETLEKFEKILKKDHNVDILIEGHTDNIGPDTFNMELSHKRALAVENHFIKAGISRDRLTIKWYGKNQPRYPNNSPSNRSKNRRVELAITANEKMKEESRKQANQ